MPADHLHVRIAANHEAKQLKVYAVHYSNSHRSYKEEELIGKPAM